MALENENGMVMPVAPMYGNGNGGFGGFGDNGWWLILLFVLLGNNGWGMGGFGGGFGGFAADTMAMYPWMNQSNQINDGFRDQMINSTINGIQSAVTSGFGDVQTALCNGFGNVQNSLCAGFAGVNASINGAQNALAQQMYTNQISDLERSFAAQTASTAGMTALQAQLAQCCCDNRAATADVKYTIATENCADRAAISDGIRDVITNATANTQAVLDKLCALELDGYKRENDNLRQQLNMSQLAASQTAQNALIQQGFSNEVDALYNRLNSCPVPTTPVYGRTPIFTCGGQTVGCGCGNGFAN